MSGGEFGICQTPGDEGPNDSGKSNDKALLKYFISLKYSKKFFEGFRKMRKILKTYSFLIFCGIGLAELFGISKPELNSKLLLLDIGSEY